MGKYSKYIYFALGVAGVVLVYNMLKKKPEQEEVQSPSQGNNVQPSITPVTGTSDSILENLDQSEADKLKEELKG